MTEAEQLRKVRDLASRIPPATNLRAMRKWLREFRSAAWVRAVEQENESTKPE